MQEAGQEPITQKKATNGWLRLLLIGLPLYFLSIFVLILTGNPNLFPTAIMLGSFLVPAAYVAFFYEHKHLSQLTMPTTASGFLYGGVLGVLGASILEPLLVPGASIFAPFVVGLIEEFVKIAGILLIARRRNESTYLDGIILGAAAGMGFAAFESTGYAFTVFMRSGGSLSATVMVTLVRALFAPVGHGTWTAILTGIVFRERGSPFLRWIGAVLGAYLTVSVLHGFWDILPDIFGALLLPLPGIFVGQGIIGVIGLLILGHNWRRANAPQ